ncbi:MAG: alpha/beta hydrolase [Leptolyngbya sp. SIO4C5]|nr:alpha/beta hydrolase [Leptolyngbya sp. SIO4C5]
MTPNPPLELILLPGMDATGLLFQPLLDELPDEIEAEVIDYPTDEVLSYSELADLVESQIADKPNVVLLAESFSGPLPIKLLEREPGNIRGVIFCATFVEPPRPTLLRIVRFLPLELLFSMPLPRWLVRLFFLGADAIDDLFDSFQQALKQVNPKVIANRMYAISLLEQNTAEIDIPCYYIQPTRDRLIPARAVRTLKRVAPQIEVKPVEGPHLILQVNPAACAAIINEFLNKVKQSLLPPSSSAIAD